MNFEVPLATGLTRVEQHPSEGAAARRFNGGWQQDDDNPEVTIAVFVLCDLHMGTGEKVFFILFSTRGETKEAQLTPLPMPQTSHRSGIEGVRSFLFILLLSQVA